VKLSTTAETWSRVGETTLLALVFLGPIAVHAHTYDPAALRTALFESCALVLAASWILKGLARGRWEAASASSAALFPALALALWTLARFAASPFKSVAAPDLALSLSSWLVYAVVLLELGGARSAARLAFWTAAATAVVGAVGAVERLTGGVSLAATLAAPEQLAAFAAVALPVVLSLRLDPEANPTRRLLSASSAVALALLAAWSGSARGLAAFGLSAGAFAVAAVTISRGPAARRTALIALGSASLAVLVAAHGTFDWGATTQGLFSGAGAVGSALLAWTMIAAAVCGLRAAWTLRGRGFVAEAGYAAALSAGFTAWAASSALGLVPRFGAGAWLAWAAAGLAAGMAPLARPRGIVLTIPLPYGADVRRLMQGPVLMLFALALVLPGGWLASDVRYNRALAEARAGGYDAALADAGNVWAGSAVYPSSLYLRGRVLTDQGKPQEALDAYARLDGVAPDFSRVHVRRAEIYASLQDWPASAHERERQSELTPLDLGNLTAWAEAARAAGDLASAHRAVDRALALTPEDPSVRTAVAANALLEKRIAERDSTSKRRDHTAFKPIKKPAQR
jgi:tetratricopeptide (TPR) repeat protein